MKNSSINKKINKKCVDNNIEIQFVEPNKLKSLAVIVTYNNKILFLFSSDIDMRVFPLSFFHEYAHLKTKTIGKKYEKKSNTIIEKVMNVLALFYLYTEIENSLTFFRYVYLAFKNENQLYQEFEIGGNSNV